MPCFITFLFPLSPDIVPVEVMAECKDPPRKKTRSSLNPDVDFPSVNSDEWRNSGHLPTFGEVIGGIRNLTGKHTSAATACKLITQEVVQHWIQRNVYPKSEKTIQNTLFAEITEFNLVKKLIAKGNPTAQTQERYEKLREGKLNLRRVLISE